MAFEKVLQWQIHDDCGRRKYLTEGERVAFLTAAEKLEAPMGALCRTLVHTGSRISEALDLRRHQVDAERLTVTLRTLKRRRVVFRTVPIPQSLALELVDLPVDEDGRFWTMHRTTAWRAIKQLMESLGISGPMACCRGLRHGFGIKAASCRVPQPLLQRWLGHASPTTTAIYVDAVGSEEREFAMRMW